MTQSLTSIRVRKGKAEYIRWENPYHGKTEDLCVCSHNVDFTLGCIAHVREQDLDGVIANNGRYPDLAMIREENNGKIAFGCDYCYARFQGMGNAHPIHYGAITEKTHEDMRQLVEDRPDPQGRIIRLGKNTEVGHPFYRSTLLDFFSLCQEYNARVIMPTKMLEFNIVVAAFLRETKSALNYSIVGDFLEEGPVSQGFTQAWRAQQAIAYHTAGVRSSVTLTCDMSGSLQHNRDLGYAVDEALSAHAMGVPLRLLPMRMPSRMVAKKATGRDWNTLVSRNAMLPGMEDPREGTDFLDGSYDKKAGGFLELHSPHPDFIALYDQLDGKTLGACGKSRGIEHCDKCGLAGSRGTVPMFRIPVEQLAPIPKFERRARGSKKKKKITGTPLIFSS